MKSLIALSVAICLGLTAPAFAQEPVATVTIASVLPYAKVGQSVVVEAGVNGMPAEVALGMIITVIDRDDANITFKAEVTTNFVDNQTPTAKWAAILLE